MKTKLNWCEGVPTIEDIYLVAIDLGPGAGYFDMCYWDGDGWRHQYPEQIIAFVGFNDLKQQLNIEWPRPEPVQDESLRMVAKDYGDEPWQEEC